MKTWILALLIFLPMAARAELCEKWDSTDTALTITAQTLIAVDWMQTRIIASAKDEANRLLRQAPEPQVINAYFAGVSAINLGLACLLDPPQRKLLQGVYIVYWSGIVSHNYRLGYKVSF